MPYKKLSNGQYYDALRGVFCDYNPYLERKTMQTKSYGPVNVYEYAEFIKLDEGSLGIIPAYCGAIEHKGKTLYANFIDFTTIKTGNRKINNSWVGFNFNFQADKTYLLLVRKDISYPAEINISKVMEITK